MKIKHLTLTDNKTFLFLWAVGTIILYQYFMLKYFSWQGDGAGFVDMLDSTSQGKGMVSSAFSAIYSLMPYLVYTFEQYMAADFKSVYYMQDFFEWHPYMITYVLVFIKSFGLSALQTASLYMAMTLAGALALLAYFLRQQKVASLYIILFIATILIFLPFAGNIFGQFYFDRLFIFHGALLLFLMYYRFYEPKKYSDTLIVIAFLLAMSISERTAIMASYIVIAFFIFNWKKISLKNDYKVLLLPVIALIYILIYMYVFQNSPYYSQISIKLFLMNLINSFDFSTEIGQKTLVMFIVLAPFIFLSAFNVKYLLLAIPPIMLNLIISVGGAEKIGFTTHYHDMYIPFLLFSATIGLVKVSSIKYRYIIFSIFMLLTFLSHNAKYEGHNVSAGFSFEEVIPTSDKNKGLKTNKHIYQSFVADIPHQSKVSSPESLWAVLVDHKVSRIDYFPIGINENDYVILIYPGIDNFTMPTIPSFLDENEKKRISYYLHTIAANNFVIEKKIFYQGCNFILYKRNNKL